MSSPESDSVPAAARRALVVGGAVMDLKMQTGGPSILATSNPGRAVWAPGGVGRNIAENLARLGSPVDLVAAVGSDPAGTDLVERTRTGGVGVEHLIRVGEPTGLYCAVVDDSGELVIGVSDMQATDSLTISSLLPHRHLIARAAVVVLDGNLDAEVISWVLDLAAGADVPVVLDPVSVPKARRIAALLSPSRPVHTVTPNIAELGGLTEREVSSDRAHVLGAAGTLHDRGVTNVWVRLGPSGSLLSRRLASGEVRVDDFSAPPATVVDVTGAGDSMTAGYLHRWLAEGDVARAAAFGQAVASLTVESALTVRPDLTTAMVDTRLRRAEPGTPT